jgi:hypothetical protein
MAWGWKLPETLIVMKTLLETFSEAKFIHCVRHPISSNLKKSVHVSSRADNEVGAAILPAAYDFCGRSQERIGTDPSWVRSAVSWQYQVTRAMEIGRSDGNGRYLEIKYEDICANQEWALAVLEKFLCIGRVRTRGSLQVNSDRMDAWDVKDPRAGEIWEICGKTAEKLGYVFSQGCDPESMKKA